MRIISGRYKGRRINAPKNLPVRPTTDMAKEALFNILNNSYYFEELSVLDLFAGSGNIGYEFASRGAKNVVTVDIDHRCVKFIQTTARDLDFEIKTIKSDVFKYLARASGSYDIVFADPPYNLSEKAFTEIPELVFKQQLLLEDGLLVIEHSRHLSLSHLPNFTVQRRYGGSVFSFFENKNK